LIFLSIVFIFNKFHKWKTERPQLHCLLFLLFSPVLTKYTLLMWNSKPIIIHFLGVLLTSRFFPLWMMSLPSIMMWPPCFFIQHNFCYNRIKTHWPHFRNFEDLLIKLSNLFYSCEWIGHVCIVFTYTW
jgi:hypothetical protein